MSTVENAVDTAPTEDPRLAALRDADTDALGEMYVEAYARVAKAALLVKPDRAVMALIETILQERLELRGGMELAHDKLDIKFALGKKPDPQKRMDVLWTLHDVKIDGIPLPQAGGEDFKKALYLEPVPPEEKRRKCDLTALKRLIKRFGAPVEQVFNKGVIYATDEDIPKKFVIALKPEAMLEAITSAEVPGLGR